VPAIEKVYIVNNGCADTVTIKNSSGTGISVPPGKTEFVYNNGTNVVEAINHLTSLTIDTALPITSGGTGTNATTFANLQSNVSGTLPVGNGGTGATTLNSAAVIIGNGASAPTFVAPGTTGNLLSSNGTAWVSVAPAAQGFDAGTVLIFGQTSAPTGWTKDTTNYNNSALRVVTGSASTGGSVNFTTAFASQTPTGSVSISSILGSAGATTLSTPQIPSHSHTLSGLFSPYGPGTRFAAVSGNGDAQPPRSTDNTGGGGSHDHPFSFSSGTASFSGVAIDLAVKYVDVIRATKN
jgi:hypothetical protein